MPASWKTDELTEGGFKGIKEMVATLVDVEEDVESQYGSQIALHFEDVEIIESVDPIVLEDGTLTSWVRQSSKKNSTNGKMLADWEEFAAAHKLGALPDAVKGRQMRWIRKEYEFGKDSDGTALLGSAFIPVELVGEGDAKIETAEVPDELADAVLAVVSDDGATKDILRRELNKKAATRKALTQLGGLEKLLAALVTSGTLDVNEGYYNVK